MLREILDKLELRGDRFLAGRLYDVRWRRGYLKDRGIDNKGKEEWGR